MAEEEKLLLLQLQWRDARLSTSKACIDSSDRVRRSPSTIGVVQFQRM
jgi:hypothetical protein